MPKKVLIALPPAMLEQVDYIAKCEHRTRSDLIRESLRRYLEAFKRTQGALVNGNWNSKEADCDTQSDS